MPEESTHSHKYFFFNLFYRKDWLLQFLYRTSSGQQIIAGLQPIEWESRRMINIDLSSVITGHFDYVKNMDTVLSAVGVRLVLYRLGFLLNYFSDF